MKYYLKDILPRLKKHSASLDQSAFLIDKPWVVSNTDEKFEKLIFKLDGTLYLSSNGNVNDGKWEYLPEAQSLLIDYGDKKKLYRHQYLDEAVLALKIDGPKNDDENYYLLANENLVPNADAKQYLENKFNSDRNIEIQKLSDGSEIILQRKDDDENIKEVTIDGSILEDGIYEINNGRKKIVVENGFITKELKSYSYESGIIIWQKYGFPTEGDIVENANAEAFEVLAGSNKFEITIANGIISKTRDLTAEREIKIAYISIFILVCIALIVLSS